MQSYTYLDVGVVDWKLEIAAEVLRPKERAVEGGMSEAAGRTLLTNQVTQ
jgi:hypothetical protein